MLTAAKVTEDVFDDIVPRNLPKLQQRLPGAIAKQANK